jgi:AraC-like DNA-binding protein
MSNQKTMHHNLIDITTPDRPREHVKIAFPETSRPTKGGRLILSGAIKGGRGIVPALPLRVYGSYAIVYITAGHGRYWDANGLQLPVTAGDLITVFPELPHTYGPDTGTTWDEAYVVFDGPAAAALREWGIINSHRPIVHLEPIADWAERILAFTPPPASANAGSVQASFFQLIALLGEIDAYAASASEADSSTATITTCCRLLSEDLAGELSIADVADRVGMAHSSLRRAFRAEVGVSMHEFRLRRRIDAARDLLRFTSMTNAQIAARLGFGDEYHFSKQFKLRTGTTPSAARSLGRG